MKPMKHMTWLTLAVLGLVWSAGLCLALDETRLRDDVRIALESLRAADSGLGKHFDTAAGYAVFPNVGKGGLILGGAHGNGIVFEKGQPTGWASLSQFTFGAQIGGQEFTEVIFFQTQAALDRFKQSKLEMSAQTSAVAAAEGVGNNAKYVDGVLVVTRAKQGLMAEASVGGQKLSFKPLPK